MDAQHIASPDVSGRQLSRAVKIALKNADALPEDISYINLHGTGTKNDIIEINALKSVFGEKVYDTPMSSTKSAHGHMIGATSATELAATILGMNYNFLPGTINLEKPVSDINLFSETKTHNYTPLSLVTSQAFGGHDTAQVVERYIRC
jgi:3-oxoacyl-(acyl-carrier-protein) synthase